jgi:hypothetical protein
MARRAVEPSTAAAPPGALPDSDRSVHYDSSAEVVRLEDEVRY